jgi:DNA-binding NarL/FixJ family response regulator
MSKPRILLADDHLLLLDGLRHLLERHYDLVGVVQDGHSVVSAAQRLQPDLVLMDVAMPILNGLQAGQRLRERQPNVKLLYVSMYGDTPYVEEALRIGASGYVLKRSGWEELSRAIETVLGGKQYISPELFSALQRPEVQPPTTREAAPNFKTGRGRLYGQRDRPHVAHHVENRGVPQGTHDAAAAASIHRRISTLCPYARPQQSLTTPNRKRCTAFVLS